MQPLGAARRSPVHATPAGVKLAALFGIGIAIAVAPGWLAGVVLAGILAGYGVARLPLAAAVQAARPLLLIGTLLFAGHALAGTLADGATALMRLAAVLMGAALVTLTTRETDIIDALARVAAPLRHLGGRPRHVALALAITLRFIPLTLADYHAIAEAARARGARRPAVQALAPLAICSLKRAHRLADAIAARGFEHAESRCAR